MYISVRKAAEFLGYSTDTVKRLIAQGRLRAYRATPTSHPRVKRSELEALMEAGQEQPAPRSFDLDEVWAQVCAKHGIHPRHRSHVQ